MRVALVIGLSLLVGLSFSGCATVDHSVLIDTDKTDANASGQYRDNRSGKMGGWGFWILGGYSRDSNPSLPWQTKQGYSDPEKFARAVAIINYSKKLKSIKYDECGGPITYEFEQQPVSYMKITPQEPGTQLKRRSTFGHQPVE